MQPTGMYFPRIPQQQQLQQLATGKNSSSRRTSKTEAAVQRSPASPKKLPTAHTAVKQASPAHSNHSWRPPTRSAATKRDKVSPKAKIKVVSSKAKTKVVSSKATVKAVVSRNTTHTSKYPGQARMHQGKPSPKPSTKPYPKPMVRQTPNSTPILAPKSSKKLPAKLAGKHASPPLIQAQAPAIILMLSTLCSSGTCPKSIAKPSVKQSPKHSPRPISSKRTGAKRQSACQPGSYKIVDGVLPSLSMPPGYSVAPCTRLSSAISKILQAAGEYNPMLCANCNFADGLATFGCMATGTSSLGPVCTISPLPFVSCTVLVCGVQQ
eukprot:jgi/Chrzof1/14850/Cz09g18120.t1